MIRPAGSTLRDEQAMCFDEPVMGLRSAAVQRAAAITPFRIQEETG